MSVSNTSPATRRASAPAALAQVAAAPIDLLLSRLERVKEIKPGHWSACCPGPAHHRGDRNPSLAIKETPDGRLLLHCPVCLDTPAILAALGLEFSDLYPPRPSNHVNPLPAGHRPRLTDRELLNIVKHEVCIVALAGDDLTQGPLSGMEQQRLRLAVRRLFAVLTNGGR